MCKIRPWLACCSIAFTIDVSMDMISNDRSENIENDVALIRKRLQYMNINRYKIGGYW